MPRAALIEDATNIVTNVAIVTNQPPYVPGAQWIIETNWAAGQEPSKGDVWDGQLPASFTTPPPVVQGDLDALEPHELIALQKANAAEATRIAEVLQTKLGG